MGAWATGTTTGAAMARIAVVKNTGPDLGKIVDTLERVRDRLRLPGDRVPAVPQAPASTGSTREGFDWSRHRVYASCRRRGDDRGAARLPGGAFHAVRSAYGASDLTIGIGAETRFTVWLRRRLRSDRGLRAALLGADEQRLPMVFQYNPFATYMETNGRRELVCTVTGGRRPPAPAAVQRRRRGAARRRTGGSSSWSARDPLAPGRVPRGVLASRADDPAAAAALRPAATRTISYLGANLYPQDVEYGLYVGNPYAPEISRFCLPWPRTPRWRPGP